MATRVEADIERATIKSMIRNDDGTYHLVFTAEENMQNGRIYNITIPGFDVTCEKAAKYDELVNVIKGAMRF